VALFFGILALARPSLAPRPRPPHTVLEDLRANPETPLPAGSRRTVYPAEGTPRALQGQLVDVSPEQLAEARQGKLVVADLPEEGGFTGLVMLSGGEVLALMAPPPPFRPAEFEQMVRMGYLRAGLLAAVICVLVGLAFSRAFTRPLRRLAAATEEFGPENLTYRIPEHGPTELAELSRSFNRMADRLQHSVETLRDSEAARREFLGDVSHNLMTPLAASMGWVQAMLDGLTRSPEEERRHLERIQRELTFVSRSVRRLLELSRWEQSDPELRFETFKLVDPLMEVVETLEEQAAARNVQLSFQGLDSRWQVEGDRGRVRELLQILLENAVLHAGGDVTVRLLAEQKAGRVWLTIADNGFGIPAEDLPFVRKGFRRSSGRNTGLGLAIADRLARSHGGVLELESETGKGTTVRFSLPAAESATSGSQS
jgi:signal transduction histidine kinase